MKSKIAVILVNWNAAGLTLDCIESIINTGYPDVNVIVVDNGSKDGSAEVIKQKYNFVTIIENDDNMGFCFANNQAIEFALRAGYDYILVLNNDTRVKEDFFEKAVRRLESSPNAVVIPKIYYFDKPAYFWFVSGTVNLWAGIFINSFYKKEDRGQINISSEVAFATGCCLMAAAASFRNIGGFDESFFMYCEDLDWSLRARAAGNKIVLEPEAGIYHHVSFSGDKDSVKRRFYMTRNHLWVLRRHSKWYHRLIWLPLVPIRSAFRCLKMLRSVDMAGMRAEVKGVIHGLFDKLPPTPEPIDK